MENNTRILFIGRSLFPIGVDIQIEEDLQAEPKPSRREEELFGSLGLVSAKNAH